MLETKTLLQNRYLIEKQIGSGGMGAVYLAVDQRFGSFVAIKETFYKDKELGSAFEREAHLLNSLHHPVLPHVSDYFTENSGHFLVMQYIEGEDLFEILKREGVFPIQDVMRWADSLLDALDYLHSQEPPIIHRDIKPQNLKITPRRDIILLDFGLAKLNTDNDSGMKSVFGYSRKYSPLEQIQGTGTDVRSDLFALAATIYNLLTGAPPLDALTRAAAIVNGDPDPLRPASEYNSHVSEAVGSALNAALALNASKRFGSAKAMRQALSHAAVSNAVEEVAQFLPESSAYIPSIEVAAATAPAEIESFPALEAYAAETASSTGSKWDFPLVTDLKDSLVVEDDEVSNHGYDSPAEIVNFHNRIDESHLNTEHYKETVFIAPEKLPASEKSYFRFGAALLALLVCGGLSTWYFTGAANPAVEANQEAVIQTESEPVSTVETVADEPLQPQPEIPKTTVPNVKSASENNKPVKSPSVAKKVEPVAETPAPIETVEKPKAIPVKAENKPSTVAKTPRVVAQPRREDSAPTNISGEVPDIESVFTGQSAQDRARKQKRQQENKRLREQMTPEEFEEFRRLRRRERQNRPSLPPF